MTQLIKQKCCDKCRNSLEHPCYRFIDCLLDGPLCHDDDRCAETRKKAIAKLRREELDRPVIFIGTGTCGLAAGARKTVNATEGYLKKHGIDADIVEVPVDGLSMQRQLGSVQLKGRTLSRAALAFIEMLPAACRLYR